MKHLQKFLDFRERWMGEEKIEDRITRLEDLMDLLLDNLYGKELHSLSQANRRKMEAQMRKFNKGRKKLSQEELLVNGLLKNNN